MATKIRASNLHTDVKTMVTTMVGENALDSAQANLLIDSKFTANNTDNLSEGSTNLYFTNARADARAQLKVDAIVGSAPGTLDTLQELGDALGDDPNFATTVTNSIATKLPLAGGTLTGNLTLTSTASGSSASPELELRRDITGADANYLGQIKFTADNDADQNVVFAKITGKILDASDGTEDGIIEFAHKKAGSNNISARFRSDSLQLINGTNLTVAGTTDLTGNLTVNTNALYVDTSNNRVGIGTSSPNNLLHLKDEGYQLKLEDTSSGNTGEILVSDTSLYFFSDRSNAKANSDIRFSVDNSEKMRINSSGNVGIQQDDPDSFNGSANQLVIGNSSGSRGITIRSGTSNSGNIFFSDGATGDQQYRGYIQYDHTNDRLNLGAGAADRIRITSSATVINEDSNDHDFRVESNGNTHALFVDAGADMVCFGTSNITGLAVQNSETGVQITSSGRIFCSNADHHDFNRTSNGDIIRFRRDTTIVGKIASTTAGTTYSTTSDRRLKDNIQPIADATDKLMSMKPVTHTWIDNPDDPQVHGFIAQEMQEVVPEAVSGDAESDEMMSMDYGRITPVIVAALQDALNEIKELKTRIDELENK